MPTPPLAHPGAAQGPPRPAAAPGGPSPSPGGCRVRWQQRHPTAVGSIQCPRSHPREGRAASTWGGGHNTRAPSPLGDPHPSLLPHSTGMVPRVGPALPPSSSPTRGAVLPPPRRALNWAPPHHSVMQSSCHGNKLGSFGSSCSLKVRREKMGGGMDGHPRRKEGGCRLGAPHTAAPRGEPPNPAVGPAAATVPPAATRSLAPPSDVGVTVPTMLTGGGVLMHPGGGQPNSTHREGEGHPLHAGEPQFTPWVPVWPQWAPGCGRGGVQWGGGLWGLPPGGPQRPGSACQPALPWQRRLTRAMSPASPHRQPH